MRVIGITGGIGSGKSRILEYMENAYGAVVCETDALAHRLQEPGTVCYRRMVACFGTDILNDDNTIDRQTLGEIVFSDTEKMCLLNEMIHPAVKEAVKQQIAEEKEKGTELFLIESALLMEDHYEAICDELWYIYVEETVRRARLRASRNMSEEKISAIMQSQADEQTFKNYCHVMIDNSGMFEQTKKQIEKAVSRR